MKRIQEEEEHGGTSYHDAYHLITHLLPSMIHLGEIRQITQEFLDPLIDVHHLHLRIFLDGAQQQPGKDLTRAKREERRRAEETALRNLFQTKILPVSFSRAFLKKGGGGVGGGGLDIPEAQVFLQEFPVPTLAFEEVYHVCFDKMVTTAADAGGGGVLGSCKVIQCDGEADASVAVASAMDITNQTYAVGQDSDYLVFGYPLHHGMWSLGDVHVQYLPLDSLVMSGGEEEKEKGVFGHVITRKQVAEEFHLSEDDVVEAAILAGNDYTLFMHDLKLRRSVNFFQHRGKNRKNRYHLTEIMEKVSEMNGGFQVESSDAEQQLWIDFSRDLYQFRDVSGYMDKVKDGGECGQGDGDVDGRILKPLQQNTNDDNIDFEAFNELLLRQSELYTELPCIRSQIMAPFHELMSDDEDFLQVLKETMDVMSSDSLKYDTIPNGLEWKDYILAEVFQRSILNALRLQSKEELGSKYAPSMIFDHLSFYPAITERNRRRIEMDDPEPTLFNPSPSATSSVSEVASKELPIDEYRDKILSSIKDNRVTIIQGETGCGKSSRVPVMILESPPPDDSFSNVKMFICQPRRIAAKSLAERVRATEPHLKNFIGLRMGHGVREYESSHTKAWFVTTGYLVRFLANNVEKFDDVTHLIIDEVHERSIDSDIICLLAKRLLESNPQIRLILMSATVAAELYQNYFGVEESPIFVGARCHPIQEYFTEDIGRLLQFSTKERNALSDLATKCIKTRCQIAPNQHYMTQVRGLAVQIAIKVGKPGSSVLTFVPGIADIDDIMEAFEKLLSTSIKYRVIPIHSDIPFDDQMVVFDTPGENEVKIIIATNAAESSITLPDVDHVICLGLAKAITYNKQSHRQMLELTWISKASAMQRAGRTGRVREGNVYRLYPREAFESHFSHFEEGEISRSPLDHIILNLRTIVQSENVSQLLMECIEPPDMINIQNSFNSLHKKNLISEPCDDFTILPLGKLVVALGIDIAIGALVGFGIRFGLLAESIELAAILSFPKSPWLIPNAHLQEPDVYNDLSSKTYASKAKFDIDLYSEPLSIMNLLYEFDHSNQKRLFCQRHYLSYERMSRFASTRDNLRRRVAAYLGKESSSLVLRKPPKSMNKSKLLALYILKVWLFYDGIVKLPSSKETGKKDTCHYTIQLKGDSIDEYHLDQILDKVKHEYTLVSNYLNAYNGTFVPVEDYNKQATLVATEFEERFLSFSITRKCNVIVTKIAEDINIYVQKANICNATGWLDECFEYSGTIQCMEQKSKKRIKGGDTGLYSIKYLEDAVEGNSEIVLMDKYSFASTPKWTKTVFKQIREKLRSTACESGVNAIIMDISKSSGGTVKVFSYGSLDIKLSKTDFISIFRTPHVTFQKCSSSSHRQAIQFPTIKNCPSDGLTVIHNSPEGARIVYGIADGRRSERRIIFKKSQVQIKDSESELEHCEVVVHGQKQCNWIWTETGKNAVLDKTTIPATIVPQGTDIYACCCNLLELKGGNVRAEGVSIIPGGKKMIDLAKLCIGIGSRVSFCVNDDDTDSDDMERRNDAAERFYQYFSQILAAEELQFFPEGVTLLCEVFHSMDGLEMIPWIRNNDDDCIEGINATSGMAESLPFVPNKNVSSPLKKTKGLHNFTNQETMTNTKRPKNQYACPICKTPFNMRELKKHICVSHLGFNTSGTKMPRQCPKCGKMGSKKSQIFAHYIDKHSNFNFTPSKWRITSNQPDNEMLCVAVNIDESVETIETTKKSHAVDSTEPPPDLAFMTMATMGQDDDESTSSDQYLFSMVKDDNHNQKETHYKCHMCNSDFPKLKKLMHHCNKKHKEVILFDRSIVHLKTQLYNLVPFGAADTDKCKDKVNDTTKAVYICTFPGCWSMNLFRRVGSLRSHIRRSHLGMKTDPSNTKKITCFECNMTLKIGNIFNHFMTQHPKYNLNIDEFKFIMSNDHGQIVSSSRGNKH